MPSQRHSRHSRRSTTGRTVSRKYQVASAGHAGSTSRT
jgi:hypothetical protein